MYAGTYVSKGRGNKKREGREIDRERKKERKAGGGEDRGKGSRRRRWRRGRKRWRRGRKRENWPYRNFFRLSKRYLSIKREHRKGELHSVMLPLYYL